jgi:glycerol-3-phosphate acyltransferase PlsY
LEINRGETTMMWVMVLVGALIGYVLGSIPVGLWVCRLYGVDIRTVGSGRTGGTNAWRAAGLKAAVPTILGDALKGAAAVLLVRWLFTLFFPEPATMTVDDATSRGS